MCNLNSIKHQGKYYQDRFSHVLGLLLLKNTYRGEDTQYYSPSQKVALESSQILDSRSSRKLASDPIIS